MVMKILREIAAGCRKLLRLAAETQLGQLGINLRQRSITQYFKVLKNPQRKPPLTGGCDQGHGENNNNNIKYRNKHITHLNKNLTPLDIFHTTSCIDNELNVLYWEFKAG
jgi:hypothetical protein